MISWMLAFLSSWSWWIVGGTFVVGLFLVWLSLTTAFSWGAEDEYHAELMRMPPPEVGHPPKFLTHVFRIGLSVVVSSIVIACLKLMYAS